MNLENIIAVASAVKGWSSCNKSWLREEDDGYQTFAVGAIQDGDTYEVAVIDCTQYESNDGSKLAEFYATCNPANVLQMAREIQRLRYALDHYAHGGSEYGKIAREALGNNTVFDLIDEYDKRGVRIAELEARLEITPDCQYDGIDTRDATIKELGAQLAAERERCAKVCQDQSIRFAQAMNGQAAYGAAECELAIRCGETK